MTVRTTAGSQLRVTAVKPATFTKIGYEAVFPAAPIAANPVVGEITDFGEFGRKYNLVEHNPVSKRGVVKLKGSFNAGAINLQLGLDEDDIGQNLMMMGRDSDSDYYFELTIQSGQRFYFAAKIMDFMVNLGGVDSVTSASTSLELTSTDGIDIVIATKRTTPP